MKHKIHDRGKPNMTKRRPYQYVYIYIYIYIYIVKGSYDTRARETTF